METDFSPPARPSSNSKVVLSPAQPLGYEPDNSTERLTSIATAQEMLNIWPASKLAGKGGSVNTADGEFLFYKQKPSNSSPQSLCLFNDRYFHS